MARDKRSREGWGDFGGVVKNANGKGSSGDDGPVGRGMNLMKKISPKTYQPSIRSGTGLKCISCVRCSANHDSGNRLYVSASLSRVRVQRLSWRARARSIVPPYDLTGACGVSGCGRNAHVVDAPRTAD